MPYLGIQGLMPRDLSQVSDATTARIRREGFSGAACRWYEPSTATRDDVARLREVMAAGGVEPCQAVAQHPDLISPDPRQRAAGVAEMRHMCRVTRWLGAGNLYLRPGSVNPRGSWYPHPDNAKPETFQVLVDSVRQVCDAAEQEGVLLAVEGHALSILDTPERIRDLIDAVETGREPLSSIRAVRFVNELVQGVYSSHLSDGRRFLIPLTDRAHPLGDG